MHACNLHISNIPQTLQACSEKKLGNIKNCKPHTELQGEKKIK